MAYYNVSQDPELVLFCVGQHFAVSSRMILNSLYDSGWHQHAKIADMHYHTWLTYIFGEYMLSKSKRTQLGNMGTVSSSVTPSVHPVCPLLLIRQVSSLFLNVLTNEQRPRTHHHVGLLTQDQSLLPVGLTRADSFPGAIPVAP